MTTSKPTTTPLASTAEPLVCCPFRHLDRRIGVRVGHSLEAGKHAGLDGQPCTQLTIETITCNTIEAGGWTLDSELEQKYANLHRRLVDDLTEVIDELTAHRDRLAAVIA